MHTVSNNTVPAAAFLMRRYRLPPSTARLIAELAGLDRIGDWCQVGSAAVPAVLRAAAVRDARRAV